MKKTTKFLEHRIKDKVKNGHYKEIFNENIAEKILESHETIAQLTAKNHNLDELIEFALEETIREMLLTKKI